MCSECAVAGRKIEVSVSVSRRPSPAHPDSAAGHGSLKQQVKEGISRLWRRVVNGDPVQSSGIAREDPAVVSRNQAEEIPERNGVYGKIAVRSKCNIHHPIHEKQSRSLHLLTRVEECR